MGFEFSTFNYFQLRTWFLYLIKNGEEKISTHRTAILYIQLYYLDIHP